MDRVLMVGTILMCLGATATAVLFAMLVRSIPDAALRGVVFVAVMVLGSTLINSRLRGRLAEERQDKGGWFSGFMFLTQFFLALAWAALVAAVFIMLRG